MADFQVYIDDDRYTVPSLYLITASSEAHARVMAAELLEASEHHQGVELWLGGEAVFALGSFAVAGRSRGGPAQAASP
jgi:hypothetical protein